MSNIFKVLSGKGSPTNNGASSPAGGNKPEVEGADEPTLAELLQCPSPSIQLLNKVRERTNNECHNMMTSLFALNFYSHQH
mmetsp:Transcript_6677/g.11235  ORF Transcript_6677/g.11235 Transcript_6677/m.11235 type:complete len:81 (+) Transcript_6677:81-323(+)